MMAVLSLAAYVYAPPVSPHVGAGRVTIQEGTTKGSVSVFVDGVEWFAPGEDVSTRYNNKLFSAADGSLKLMSDSTSNGVDAYGAYERRTWMWQASDLYFETSARVYDEAVVFAQRWRGAAAGVSAGDKEGLSSVFPSFAMPLENSSAPTRGYLQYEGDMVGSGYHLGQWDHKATGVGSGVTDTGPLCIFAADLKTSVVLSPLGANVMTSSQKYSGPGTHLSYGLLGSVADVPAGYTLEFVLSVGRGVRPAMLKWGDLLLANSGKRRDAAWDLDYSLRYLGYMRRANPRAIRRSVATTASSSSGTRRTTAPSTTTTLSRVRTTRRRCSTSRATPRPRASRISTGWLTAGGTTRIRTGPTAAA